jgi:hypothetical protein
MRKIGTPPKKSEKRSAFIVADVTMSFRSRRRWTTCTHARADSDRAH